MAAVTAAMVKELREMTGAGMMDCKKALSAVDGDMDKAVEFLREKGLAAAAKKASRIAAEGLVKTLVADFQEYVAQVAEQAMNTTAADIDAFLAEPWALDTTKTVAEELSSKISIIGEKLSIRRFAQVNAEGGCVVAYTHGGGRIGVLVEAETEVVNDEVKEALKNIAMQIAALRPQYVSRDEVSDEFIAHEKEILMAQIMNDPKESAKPEKVIQGMIQGRISKELKDFCLMDQVYVKAEDGKQTVAQYMQQVSKAVGAPVAVKKFVRFETGEGMQKKEENFAEEVAKQMGQ